MQSMTIENATIKANQMTAELNARKSFIKELQKAIKLIPSFDGKILNARMFNVLNEETELRFYNTSIMDSAEVSYWDKELRGSIKSNVHWGIFNTFTGEIKEAQVYNPDADNLSGRTFLTEYSTGKHRIVASGWVEVLEGIILMEKSTIKQRKKFTNADAIKKAFDKEDELKAQIRKLEDKMRDARPHYLTQR